MTLRRIPFRPKIILTAFTVIFLLFILPNIYKVFYEASYQNNKFNLNQKVNCEYQFEKGFDINENFCVNESLSGLKKNFGISKFECWHNYELQSSICEGNYILIKFPRTNLFSLKEHFDAYRNRLFLSCNISKKLPIDRVVKGNYVFDHRYNSLSQALSYLPYENLRIKCEKIFFGRMYLVKRLWHNNIFHTISDIFNTYQTIKRIGDSNSFNTSSILIISEIEHYPQLWNKLFGENIFYVFLFKQTNLCFENAIFVPVSASSGLGDYNFLVADNKYKTNSLTNLNFTKKFLICKKKNPVLINFIKFFLSAFELQTSETNSKSDKIRVTFTIRKIARVIQNQKELINKIYSISQERKINIKVKVIDFSKLGFKEQLEAILKTDILIGIHGAGLTHALFMQEGSAVLEFRPSTYYNDQYKVICDFLNIHYNTFYIKTNESSINVHLKPISFIIDVDKFAFYFKKSILEYLKI